MGEVKMEAYMCPECGEILFGEEELKEHWKSCASEEIYESFEEWRSLARYEYVIHRGDIAEIIIKMKRHYGKGTLFNIAVVSHGEYKGGSYNLNSLDQVLESVKRWIEGIEKEEDVRCMRL